MHFIDHFICRDNKSFVVPLTGTRRVTKKLTKLPMLVHKDCLELQRNDLRSTSTPTTFSEDQKDDVIVSMKIPMLKSVSNVYHKAFHNNAQLSKSVPMTKSFPNIHYINQEKEKAIFEFPSNARLSKSNEVIPEIFLPVSKSTKELLNDQTKFIYAFLYPYILDLLKRDDASPDRIIFPMPKTMPELLKSQVKFIYKLPNNPQLSKSDVASPERKMLPFSKSMADLLKCQAKFIYELPYILQLLNNSDASLERKLFPEKRRCYSTVAGYMEARR